MESDVMRRVARKTQTQKRRLRLILADDHPVVVEGIRALLEKYEHIEVVGQASDGEEAVELARRLQPDAVLMDVTMPRLSGIEATKQLRAETPAVKVLILTVHENKEYVLRLIRAGARGYLLKDSPAEELVRGIEAVCDGAEFFSSRVSEALSTSYADLVKALDKCNVPELSDREREVLRLIAQGRSSKEVANELEIGLSTALTHRKRLMRKLSAHNAAELTAFALQNGIVNQ